MLNHEIVSKLRAWAADIEDHMVVAGNSDELIDVVNQMLWTATNLDAENN